MADNVTTNPGSGGAVVATDDIGGIHYQRVKVGHGADGSYTDASATNPLPVVVAGLQIPTHDHITLGYTGSDLTSVVYRTGGSGGTTVATLTLAYTSGNLTSITRT